MNLFQTLLVVAFVPTVCNGIKCYSCDATAEEEVPAPCTANQPRAIQTCTKRSPENRYCGLTESLTKDGIKIATTALGCRIGSKNEDPLKCAIYFNNKTGLLYRTCRCKTDLCNNNIDGLKCFACKGKPLSIQQQSNDYQCSDGEIAEERFCPVDEPVCIYKWNSDTDLATRGCYKYRSKKLPCCRKNQKEKWCYCNNNMCNTMYNDTSVKRCSGNSQYPSSILISVILVLNYYVSIFFAILN